MSKLAQFLFDECIGLPMMQQLRASVPTEATFVHISTYFHAGIQDREWIPRLAQEGGWVVITADGGKKSKHGDKLPELCDEHKITHVILSPALHRRMAHEKSAIIQMMWSQIEPLAEAPAGSRFHLRLKTLKRNNGVSAVLEEECLTPLQEHQEPPSKPDAVAGQEAV